MQWIYMHTDCIHICMHCGNLYVNCGFFEPVRPAVHCGLCMVSVHRAGGCAPPSGVLQARPSYGPAPRARRGARILLGRTEGLRTGAR